MEQKFISENDKWCHPQGKSNSRHFENFAVEVKLKLQTYFSTN